MTAAIVAVSGLFAGVLIGMRAALAQQRIDGLIVADTRTALVDDAAELAIDEAS